MSNEKGLKVLVERLLREDKRCLQNNKWLTIRVFQEVAKRNGENFYCPYLILPKLPSFESVASCKRQLIREGKFKKSFEPEEGVTYEPKTKEVVG